MADKTLNVKFKQRYDTEANWKAKDPVLLAGEMAISSDKNGMYKVGDGSSKWSALSYAKSNLEKSDVTTALGYTPPTTNSTYSTGTSSYSGTTKLYTSTGSNTDGTMTQNAIKTELDKKLSLSGGEATGEIKAPNLVANKYFTTPTMVGEGDDSTYYHRVDWGGAGNDKVDFYEYGGTWNFYQNQTVDGTGKTLVGSIQPDGFHGNVIGNASTATKATQDSSGNTITSTYATKTELENKVDKVSGKGLSTNDYTTAEKNKLAGIATGATANTGTITGVKMNGSSKGTSGVVDLGTVLTGGKQTSTSSADGGSNVYTFSDGSTITVKNGSKGSTGSQGPQGEKGATGSQGPQGEKGATGATGPAGTSVTVSNVSESTASGGSNVVTFSDGKKVTIKNGVNGTNGSNGKDGVTPTIKAAGGTSIGSVGTPTVTASTSGTTTTFTFNNLKGQKGDKGDPGVNATTTSVATTSANGLMSSEMVGKLNGIADGANNFTYTHPSYTSRTKALYKVAVDGTGHVNDVTAVTKADITGLGICASDDSRLSNARPASDVYSWAKESSKPTYTASEIDWTNASLTRTEMVNGANIIGLKTDNDTIVSSITIPYAGSANSGLMTAQMYDRFSSLQRVDVQASEPTNQNVCDIWLKYSVITNTIS